MPAAGPGIGVHAFSGDIVQLSIVTRSSNQAGLIVRHYRMLDTVDASVTLGEIVTLLNTGIQSIVKNLLSVNAIFVGIQGRVIRPVPPSAPAFNIDELGPGTVLGDQLPKQTCGVISYSTRLAGRKYRGRSYVPFPGEADSDSAGKPVNDYITRLGLLRNALVSKLVVIGAGGTGTLEPCVFHRKDATDTPIIAGTTRLFWGTQRRRGDFGHPNPAIIG